MDRLQNESDDILFKIGETLNFYGKTLEPTHRIIWLRAFASFGTVDILKALDNHIGSADGKYSPRPADIIKLLTAHNQQKRFNKDVERAPEGNCDPKIAAAWSHFLRLVHGFNMPGHHKIELTNEEVLEIVNEQAVKHDQPDAIPDEYKIQRFWPGYACGILA